MPKIPRENYRQFNVAVGSAIVVAVLGKGEILRRAFEQLNDQKIVVVLGLDPELNADKITFADEVLILNESSALSDFELEVAETALHVLKKPLLTLIPVNQESEDIKDEETAQNENQIPESSDARARL